MVKVIEAGKLYTDIPHDDEGIVMCVTSVQLEKNIFRWFNIQDPETKEHAGGYYYCLPYLREVEGEI